MIKPVRDTPATHLFEDMFVNRITLLGKPDYVTRLKCMAGAAEAAQQFRQQRMFGQGVKRSQEMLVPAAARYFGPSLTF